MSVKEYDDPFCVLSIRIPQTKYIYESIRLAETGNYQEASEELFISQSGLSKHIKKLESDLGCVLFNRTTRVRRAGSHQTSFTRTTGPATLSPWPPKAMVLWSSAAAQLNTAPKKPVRASGRSPATGKAWQSSISSPASTFTSISAFPAAANCLREPEHWRNFCRRAKTDWKCESSTPTDRERWV